MPAIPQGNHHGDTTMTDSQSREIPPVTLHHFPEGGNALIQGASRGIGLGFVRALLAGSRVGRVVATCRDPQGAGELQQLRERYPDRLWIVALEVTDEASIARAAGEVRERVDSLAMLVNTAGVLHEGEMGPEKKLEDVSLAHLEHGFRVNTFGPLLMARYFAPLLRHRQRAVFASLSARVGSITDNRLGGWYAYRGAKAAQNMFTRNLSLEFRRRLRNVIVVALHPGTTDTGLSRPFQDNVTPEKLFPVDYAVACLLNVMDGLEPEQSGGFYAYDGSEIPW